jgi:hypothetical protein
MVKCLNCKAKLAHWDKNTVPICQACNETLDDVTYWNLADPWIEKRARAVQRHKYAEAVLKSIWGVKE